MIVTLGANVMTITAAMVLATILVNRLTAITILVNLLTAITIGAPTVAKEIATMKTGVATMKTGVVAMKSAATTQGTTMIAMLTDEMGAALMRHSVLAVAVVVVEESLVRTLWLNFPPPRFGCRN
jgi:1,2-phenylacetyl-CoA epoxidase catalytic subunit